MPRRRWWILAALLLPAEALASTGHGPTLISAIAVSIVTASVLGLLARLFRLPLLLGYLLAGVAVGPIGLGLISDRGQISEIAEVGLILLLFMIGLEIDLKKMLGAGRLVVVTGALQFPLSAGFAFLVLAGLQRLGLPLGAGRFTALYLAVAVSISSTMIVVKLLYDKLELDSLAGRITLGILVFQDIWAIVVLAIQPNLGSVDLARLGQTFGAGHPPRRRRARVQPLRAPLDLQAGGEGAGADGGALARLVLRGRAHRRAPAGRALDGDGRADRRRLARDVPLQPRGDREGAHPARLLHHPLLRRARDADPLPARGGGGGRRGALRGPLGEPARRGVRGAPPAALGAADRLAREPEPRADERVRARHPLARGLLRAPLRGRGRRPRSGRSR